MAAQKAVTNTIASVAWGGMELSAETCKYRRNAVAPNRPRYNVPSFSWAEYIAPELPDGIVHNAMNAKTPTMNK